MTRKKSLVEEPPTYVFLVQNALKQTIRSTRRRFVSSSREIAASPNSKLYVPESDEIFLRIVLRIVFENCFWEYPPHYFSVNPIKWWRDRVCRKCVDSHQLPKDLILLPTVLQPLCFCDTAKVYGTRFLPLLVGATSLWRMSVSSKQKVQLAWWKRKALFLDRSTLPN